MHSSGFDLRKKRWKGVSMHLASRRMGWDNLLKKLYVMVMIFIELNGICNWMKGWPFYTIFIFVKFFDNLTFRYPEMAKGILKDQTDINISKQEKVFVGENKWNGFQQCLHNISYPPHNHSRWNIFNANIIVISVFFSNVNVNLSSKSPALSLSLSSSSWVGEGRLPGGRWLSLCRRSR